jgi:hypothetical protein
VGDGGAADAADRSELQPASINAALKMSKLVMHESFEHEFIGIGQYPTCIVCGVRKGTPYDRSKSRI